MTVTPGTRTGLSLVTALAVLIGSTALVGCFSTRVDPFEQEVLHNKVVIGMTPTHVRNAWDEPCDKRTFTTPNGQLTLWQYCTPCLVVQDFKFARKEEYCMKSRRILFSPDNKVIEVELD